MMESSSCESFLGQEDTLKSFDPTSFSIKPDEANLDEMNDVINLYRDEDFSGTIVKTFSMQNQQDCGLSCGVGTVGSDIDIDSECEDSVLIAEQESSTPWKLKEESDSVPSNFIVFRERLKEIGRVQSETVEMLIVVDDRVPEDKYLKCISCGFIMPVPKGPPGVLIEKALAIRDMRNHFMKNHQDELLNFEKESIEQPTWVEDRKQIRKWDGNRRGRPLGSFIKNMEKVDDGLQVGDLASSGCHENVFKSKCDIPIDKFVWDCCGDTSLADRIKMCGRKK